MVVLLNGDENRICQLVDHHPRLISISFEGEARWGKVIIREYHHSVFSA